MATDWEQLATLSAPTRHVFLSPHYDDISLSVGATVRQLANQGRCPETVIIFGSEPDPDQPLSHFADFLHDAWGFTASDVISKRRAEEAAASERLGATMCLLPFRDAIYRGHNYLSDDDIFGVPAAADRDIPQQIGKALDLPATPDPNVRIYAPLGVGRHVDHQLAFLAGANLASNGWNVWFYEDIPYSLPAGKFAARMAELSEQYALEPALNVPVADTWEAKLEAILCYPSQLETVFRSYVGVGTTRREISDALAAYASRDHEENVAERFWKIDDASSSQGS